MKASKEIIKVLNQVLTTELTSINQYFLHARIYKNWGLESLNSVCYKKSIKDMKQADKLIERILFLEGLPNLQALGRLSIGEHTQEMLACDKGFQEKQLEQLREAVNICEEAKDYISRQLLEEILEYEENHHAWIEEQEDLIEEIGTENYLQLQIA